MNLDNLIETLLRIRKKHPGNVRVVCGLDRSGYGEELDHVDVTDAHSYDEESGGYDENSNETVIDLVCTEHSIVSSTAS